MTRTASPRVLPMIVDRWSPRSFDGAALPQDDLDVIFEGAGLAASAYNYQPWRFLYAHRADEALFAQFLQPLAEFNQTWARNASVLLYVVSDEVMVTRDGANPNHSHSFDAGAAWANLALQALALGYHTHGMTGVDFAKARDVLKVPEGFRIDAAIALGTRAPADRLPDALREREVQSGRKPVAEVAWSGTFR
ncbi:MAG: nitroreductase family protein [Pseudomonadota bacterium]